MSQGSNMDMSRVTTGERIVLGAAGLFFLWTFLPVWYTFSAAGISSSLNGFRSVTLVAWLISVLAIAEILLRSLLGVKYELPVKAGVLHVVLAGVALLMTVLGLLTAPDPYGVGWGLIVAIILALAWTYGAYVMYSEPEMPAMGPPSSSDTPGYPS